MQFPNPIPHTLREAVWSALVAMLLATRLKDIAGFFRRFWVAITTSNANSKARAADAHKTDAEAEEIEARTAISTASLIREMAVSMGQAELLRDRLRGEMASKESIIELQKAEIRELRAEHPEDVEKGGSGPNPAA